MSTKIKLDLTQKQKLLKIKRKHQSSIIQDRAHAVLLRNEGFTLANTAKALSRSDKFVKNSIKQYGLGQLNKLNFNSNNHKLTNELKKEIIKMIRRQCPKALKGFNFKTQFWSTDILKEVIKRKYHIEYKTDKSYYDLFKCAGFTFHKPKPRDVRQDPEKIKGWKGALKKSYKSTKIRLSW